MTGAPPGTCPNSRCISAAVRGSSALPAVSSIGPCVDRSAASVAASGVVRLTPYAGVELWLGKKLVTVGQRAWEAAMASAIGSAPLIRLTMSPGPARKAGTPAVVDSFVAGFVPAPGAMPTASTPVPVA